MSGRAWTPGPWSLRWERGGSAYIDARNGTVCEIEIGWRPDALLIAAAPDLFEALASVIAANDEFRRALPADWQSDPVNDACDAARAALSKAEGVSA